jgi:uncharacterized short protein YbdD (DUF466 family)
MRDAPSTAPVASEIADARPPSSSLRRTFAPFLRAACVLREVGVGVLALDAYETYVAHRRRHHPDEAVLSREEFFRRDQADRWNGVRRCC